MPLSDHEPVIDNRSYSDIVAEARNRIPRYTPEWTDFNASDPGSTLIELFAWMTEMQLFRLGKVPALNYIKFLELVGIGLQPARPARCEITFPVRQGHGEPYVLVPARTQVATQEPDDAGPIIFETERSLIALTARLDAVQIHDGHMFSDASRDNDEAAAGFSPFGSLATTDSALLLGFDHDEGFPSVELDLAFFIDAPSRPPTSWQWFQETSVYTSSVLAWEYHDGSDWKSLDVLVDETRAFTATGHVRIKALNEGSIGPTQLGVIEDPRYWIRARLATSDYDQSPRLLAVRTNTVPAQEAQTAQDEILGGSSGRPDHTLSLASTPVLEGTLVLEIDEGDGFVPWTVVADLYGSGPDDTHVTLDRMTGEIRFGDGVRGRIPVANPQRPSSNIVAREYRYGGGRRGNLSAGSLQVPLSSLRGIQASAISNLLPATGGSDEETMDEARKRAPRTLKSRERAVTGEDYELLAMRSGNIKRARALPLFHPRHPTVPVPGVISVIVIPDVEGEAPMPSQGTLRTVCAYLDQRRLLTTELYVLPPRYREVRVTADIIAHDDADLATVKMAAAEAIGRYFHPLVGGDDSGPEVDGSGWPFGGSIYYGLVLHRLMVEGVLRVAELTIEIDGEPGPACQDIALEPTVLLTNGDHDIQVRYRDGGRSSW